MLLGAAVLLGAAALAGADRPARPRQIAGGLVVAILVHVVVAGVRWQVVPAYVACGICMAGLSVRRRLLRSLLALTSGLLIAPAVLATWAFPVFDLPAPDGMYAVGTATLEFVDDQRDEEYTDDPNDRRRLMLRVWYPTDSNAGSRTARYWEHAVERS